MLGKNRLEFSPVYCNEMKITFSDSKAFSVFSWKFESANFISSLFGKNLRCKRRMVNWLAVKNALTGD